MKDSKVNETKMTEKKHEEENVYKTADFVLSVFLLYSDVKLLRVEPYPDDKNENRKIFVFEKTDQLETLMSHFISSDPNVKIKKLMAMQRLLKKMIYDNLQPSN
jgi:hypothetical protein